MMKKLVISLSLLLSFPVFSAENNTDKEYLKSPSMNDYLDYSYQEDVDSINYTMLNEVAETFGYRGGKTERSIELLKALDEYEKTLDLIYRFEPLVSKQGFIPPVIVESKDVAHITDEQMRTGAKVFEIIKPARFVSNPPSWRSYLTMGLYSSAIDKPEYSTLPKNSAEKVVWKKGVVRGWQKGREDADDILISNFNRLTRDYNGMLRYSTLLQLNMIQPPVIDEKSVTVTGSDNRMILGDSVKTIKGKSYLILDKSKWKPSINIQD